MALEPLNLFVTHNGLSSRQRVTCRYKCADACFHPVSNSSDDHAGRATGNELSPPWHPTPKTPWSSPRATSRRW
jgi:hypothetical protein